MKCKTNDLSSRTCQKKTRSCIINHHDEDMGHLIKNGIAKCVQCRMSVKMINKTDYNCPKCGVVSLKPES
jgi:hypothetical protein